MKICIKDVSKRIKGRTVLDHISAEFKSGKIYGLRGHNGSGKTMLLRIISGLIRPTEGKVLVNEQVLGKEQDYPKSMGLLIENPAFLNDFTGYENLKMIASLNGVINDKDIFDTLNKVGLESASNTKYHKYSLGMKQRLGIAAAIMEKPELILLDEPTNALDDEGIESIEKLILSLKTDNRLIIVASHEKAFLERISDEIILMNEGRIDSVEETCTKQNVID